MQELLVLAEQQKNLIVRTAFYFELNQLASLVPPSFRTFL